MRTLNSASKQRGLSLFGFIILAAVVGFVMFTSFRCVPAWTEFFSLKKVLLATANEFSIEASSPVIRNAFDRRAQIDDLPVKGSELDIRKENGKIVLAVSYARRVPVAGNMSLLFDFEASAAGSK
ncbi:MAG: DUF4845 domain-containing protein [Betaproteobacteria bacterium]|nr:MAG: DUF4845 domain-containing protein [Betaproteobacteria bacterium]